MNRVRGEQRLTVGNVEYILRPENSALANIEGRLDVGLFDLAGRFIHSKPRNTDIAVILQECSKAAGKELPYGQAFDFSLLDLGAAAKCAKALLLERFGPAAEPEAGKEPATGS